jgi:two-component system NarL family sensor kinase
MPAPSLSEAFLDQSPACHWVVDAAGVFHQFWGDPSLILGKPAADLRGRDSSALPSDVAGQWKDRFSRALAGEVLTLRVRRNTSLWNVSIFPIRGQDATAYAGILAREVSPWNSAEQELRRTVLSALKAMEFDRGVLSKFLHDKVGQNLTALGLQLDLMRMDLEPVLPDSCRKVAEIQKVLEDMMEEVREFSYELNPSAVERAGLRSALDRLVIRLRQRFVGNLRLNVDPSLKIDPKLASAMYQIAQEAAENAVQHASCSSLEIAVKSSRSGTLLEVRDNGRGFDPHDLGGGGRGLGLLSMEHYAAQAGLELTISSNRNTGTVIRANTQEAV